LDPSAVNFFCFRGGMGDAGLFVHTHWTIYQRAGMQRAVTRLCALS
jgi:hypothetical protein